METGAAAAWQTSSVSVFILFVHVCVCVCVCVCVYVYVQMAGEGGVFCAEAIVTCASNILLDRGAGLCLPTSVTWPES